MPGSYNHIINDDGNLIDITDLTKSIENLGDAYDAIEEMYGMIWWLAVLAGHDISDLTTASMVEFARTHYKDGLVLAKNNQSKKKAHN